MKPSYSGKSQTITGAIKRATFYKEETGWGVFLVQPAKPAEKEMKIQCVIPAYENGLSFNFTGTWKLDEKYGPQFVAKDCELKKIETPIECFYFLVDNIGMSAANARLLVEHEPDLSNILRQNALSLRKYGINSSSLSNAQHKLSKLDAQIQAKDTLMSWGFTPLMAKRIHDYLGENLVDAIQKDPYKLTEVPRVTFKKLDPILLGAKVVELTSINRLAACVEYNLSKAADEGHTWQNSDELLLRTIGDCGVSSDVLHKKWEEILDYGTKQKRFTSVDEDNTMLGLTELVNAERDIASTLLQVRDRGCKPISVKKPKGLNSQQEQALQNVNKSVSILTGGPGTGKTFTLKSWLEQIPKSEDVYLCAPTGKAAKRMTDSTGREASTIHSLIAKFEKDGPPTSFTLVIDEASMISVELLNDLLTSSHADSRAKRILFVGDDDQLPSIGAGRVLHDLISSEQFSTVKLTEIMRQAGTSEIIQNAAAIREGKPIEQYNDGKDFYVTEIQPGNDYGYAELIKKAFVDRIIPGKIKREDGTKYDPIEDVQVVTPRHSGALGNTSLNKMIQQILNPGDPSKKEWTYVSPFDKDDTTTFREGDKILVTKNNQKIGVINGDIGRLTKITPKGNAAALTVSFDDERVIDFSGENLQDLTLGYSITVHKSQGSEAPFLIAIFPEDKSPLNDRALVYTGITRAKERCWLLAHMPTLNRAINTNKTERRKTALDFQLAQVTPSEDIPM